MSAITNTDYYSRAYGVAQETAGTKRTGTVSGSFLEMAAQAAAAGSSAVTAGFGSTAGMLTNPTALMMDLSVRYTGQLQTDGSEDVQAPSLEEMLKAKYPNLVYHVFDASSGYWKSRNDYPHYLLYQEGDKAKETLENWKPEGANPFYGSIDGRFTAPKEIHALGSVPPGSKAVVIHPKVQERMEQDPAYAREIYAKIDAWFTFDVARNEAIMPGSTYDMSQAVAIGEDGNICNACSSSAGGEITQSSDEMVRAYRLRMAKHADFMRWLAHEQIENGIQQAVRLADADAARQRLAGLMKGSRLKEIFGSEIAGVPTETVLEITRTQIWGAGTLG